MGRKKKVASAKTAAENGVEITAATAPKRKGKKKAASEGAVAESGESRPGTLAAISAGYLAHMEEAGKSDGTIASYGMELKMAMSELGEETLVADLTAERVQEYFDSPRVTRLRSGKPKAKPSVDKTRRVLRLALVWAQSRGIVEQVPIPETVAETAA